MSSASGLYFSDGYKELKLRKQQNAACEEFFEQHFCLKVQKLQGLRRSQFMEPALDEVCV